jgi:hypothetical protein
VKAQSGTDADITFRLAVTSPTAHGAGGPQPSH